MQADPGPQKGAVRVRIQKVAIPIRTTNYTGAPSVQRTQPAQSHEIYRQKRIRGSAAQHNWHSLLSQSVYGCGYSCTDTGMTTPSQGLATAFEQWRIWDDQCTNTRSTNPLGIFRIYYTSNLLRLSFNSQSPPTLTQGILTLLKLRVQLHKKSFKPL
ncbi:hypothetical protein SS50377_23926 [Spironucleus salmonicida]|uniref:Uncharacterized protein n=1 Tax=Spironucleus salmonicida TaxID=348837 RepID=V6LUS3_9EUKA|nr:hypothetical protein SS50377_23926 [Spironucleus salmonicida]|eukprot:EST48320.1 Hypothetical protein SS50377_11522 [Spironucleus salmonicida]